MHQPLSNSSDDSVDDYGNVIVSGKELGSVLALTESRISALKRRGILQPAKAKKTEFSLDASVRAYIQYKCGTSDESEADFHKERALKERANRVLREILVEQTRGQLHRAEDVEAIQADSNCEIRSRLSKFGNELSLQIAGKEPDEIKTIIDSEIRKVLNDLAEYDPRDYYRRSKIVLSEERSQPAKAAVKKPGWPLGKPRGSKPQPWAAESNRRRWADNPQKLAQTIQKMNDARRRVGLSDQSRHKMAESQRKRWASMSSQARAAQLSRVQAGRGRDFAKAGWAARRQKSTAVL
jgi:hypothetical protein